MLQNRVDLLAGHTGKPLEELLHRCATLEVLEQRDAFTGHAFIRDLASRLAHRVQVTTDGHKVYLEAIEGAFGADVDHAMLIKMHEGDSGKNPKTRYSPAHCTGAREQRITGNPTRPISVRATSSGRTSRCA
jgi:hypothetical protein